MVWFFQSCLISLSPFLTKVQASLPSFRSLWTPKSSFPLPPHTLPASSTKLIFSFFNTQIIYFHFREPLLTTFHKVALLIYSSNTLPFSCIKIPCEFSSWHLLHLFKFVLWHIIQPPLKVMSLKAGTISVLFITLSFISRVLIVSKYMIISIS